MRHLLVKSSNFIRSAKKLLKRYPDLPIELNEVLLLLTENVFDSKLKSHKLKGEMKDFWSCSINFDLRLIFQFVKAINEETGELVEAILLVNIGTHDEVY